MTAAPVTAAPVTAAPVTAAPLRARPWRRGTLLFLATVASFHLLTVWAIPRLIMRRVITVLESGAMGAHNRAAFPPPVDARSRQIVMPSPDLLYSICAYDLRAGPVRVTAQPRLANYWSIALYADNSDNYFVVNDRQADGGAVDIWIVPEGLASSFAVPNDVTTSAVVKQRATVVASPSMKGLMLMRALVGDYAADSATVEPARRTLQCRSTRS